MKHEESTSLVDVDFLFRRNVESILGGSRESRATQKSELQKLQERLAALKPLPNPPTLFVESMDCPEVVRLRAELHWSKIHSEIPILGLNILNIMCRPSIVKMFGIARPELGPGVYQLSPEIWVLMTGCPAQSESDV